MPQFCEEVLRKYYSKSNVKWSTKNLLVHTHFFAVRKAGVFLNTTRRPPLYYIWWTHWQSIRKEGSNHADLSIYAYKLFCVYTDQDNQLYIYCFNLLSHFWVNLWAGSRSLYEHGRSFSVEFIVLLLFRSYFFIFSHIKCWKMIHFLSLSICCLRICNLNTETINFRNQSCFNLSDANNCFSINILLPQISF